MCGIAGLINPIFPNEDMPQAISAMLSAIAHRGPDGAGYVLDNDFAMGTVRLAVIDPEAGVQPISDPSRRYWLCYNGEIYNYKELRAKLETHGRVFKTHCDTEVVLQAWLEWGDDCLEHLNGGFSFAVYDRKRKRLVLVRDRFGKRPLFYVQKGETLYFASEMKAFLSLPDVTFEQDPEQLASIFGQWTPLPEQTGFKGIKNLGVGEWLSFENTKLERHVYAPLQFNSNEAIANEKEAIARIRDELHSSVSLRLRSDVEVGVYLSGGVDSAIIASLAHEHTNTNLTTFSVTFEDTQFDESIEQQMVAQHLGCNHYAQHIGFKDIVDNCPQAVYHAEIPAFRSAFVPMFLLSKLTQEKGIKVILSGEGADEAFLGYDLFKETMLRKSWNEYSESERSDRLKRFYPHLSHFSGKGAAALTGLYQQFSKENMPGLFSHEMRFQNGRFSARLMAKGTVTDPFTQISELVSKDADFQKMSGVEKAQWLEYKTLLPGYLLSTQGERMSLAHGVENRCPFLDPKVIAIAAATNLKFDDGFREKRLLREAFRGKLPEAIIDKRKFPYRAPDTEAFVTQKPDYLELVQSEQELAKLPFLDQKFIPRLVQKIMNTPADRISTKENQTFMFLLSTVLLHRSFVSKQGLGAISSNNSLPPLQKVVDLRN